MVFIACSFSWTAAGVLATNGCSLAMQRVLLGFLEIGSASEAGSDSFEETGTFLDCFRRRLVVR